MRGCWRAGSTAFDWLKDRIKRPKVVVDLSQVTELRGIREVDGGLEIGAMTTLTEVVHHPVVREKFGLLMEAAELVGLAADPQSGDARRQRVAGHALLVLPERLDVLPRGREHLLRGHADGDQPRARDLRRGPVRGGEPVGHGAGADRAGRADGDPQPSGGERVVDAEDYFVGPGIDITRMTVLRPGELLTAIRIPATWAGAQFYFEKVRDRQVWDFPLVNVASAMKVSSGTIEQRADRGGRGGGDAAAADGGGSGASRASRATKRRRTWPASWRSRARSRCATTATRFR